MTGRRVALNPAAEAWNLGTAAASLLVGRTLSRPLYVNVYVNLRCNSRCVSCDAWRRPTPPQLERADIERVITGLGDLGTRYVKLSGGEPLLHPEIAAIVAAFRTAGIFVQLSTNGLLLDERRARALLDAGVTRLTVSVDTLDPQTYRAFRGVDGLPVVLKNLAGLVRLARGTALVETNTLLGEHNLRELPQLIERLLSFGIDYASISSIEPMSRIIHDEDKRHLFPRDGERLDEVVAGLIDLRRRTGRINTSVPFLRGLTRYYRTPTRLVYPCRAAWLRMEVLPDGGLGLCGPMGTFGSLRREGLRDFWFGARAEAERARIARGDCPVCYGPCYTEPSLLLHPRHAVVVGLDRLRRLVLGWGRGR
jgi:MoaA/NifB/PqqE/SkfB family radical SAM enzyme